MVVVVVAVAPTKRPKHDRYPFVLAPFLAMAADAAERVRRVWERTYFATRVPKIPSRLEYPTTPMSVETHADSNNHSMPWRVRQANFRDTLESSSAILCVG